jgi:hypothetical protein
MENKKQQEFAKQIFAKPKGQTCSELTNNGELCKNFIWKNHPCCYAHHNQNQNQNQVKKTSEPIIDNKNHDLEETVLSLEEQKKRDEEEKEKEFQKKWWADMNASLQSIENFDNEFKKLCEKVMTYPVTGVCNGDRMFYAVPWLSHVAHQSKDTCIVYNKNYKTNMGLDLDFKNHAHLIYFAPEKKNKGKVGPGLQNAKILSQLNLCVAGSKITKQIVIPITLATTAGDSHANILILNLERHTIERYNPWGVKDEKKQDEFDFADQQIIDDISAALPIEEDIAVVPLKNQIQSRPSFSHILSTVFDLPTNVLSKTKPKPILKKWKMLSFLDTCPYVGPQIFGDEKRRAEKYCKNPKDIGFCTLYSLLYGHLRILGPNIQPQRINDLLISGVLGLPKEEKSYQDQLLDFVLAFWMMVRVESTMLIVGNIEHVLRIQKQLYYFRSKPSPTVNFICSQTFDQLWVLAEAESPIFILQDAVEVRKLKRSIEKNFVKPQFLWQASDHLIFQSFNNFDNSALMWQFLEWIKDCRYDLVKQLHNEGIWKTKEWETKTVDNDFESWVYRNAIADMPEIKNLVMEWPSILLDFRYDSTFYSKLETLPFVNWLRVPGDRTNLVRWNLAIQLPPLKETDYNEINELNKTIFSKLRDYYVMKRDNIHIVDDWCLTRLRIILPGRGCRT